MMKAVRVFKKKRENVLPWTEKKPRSGLALLS